MAVMTRITAALLALYMALPIAAQQCPVRRLDICSANSNSQEMACVADHNSLAVLFDLNSPDNNCCWWAEGPTGGTKRSDGADSLMPVNPSRRTYLHYADTWPPPQANDRAGFAWYPVCTRIRDVIFDVGLRGGACSDKGAFDACLTSPDPHIQECLCQFRIHESSLKCMSQFFKSGVGLQACSGENITKRKRAIAHSYHVGDFTEFLAEHHYGSSIDIEIDLDGVPYYPAFEIYGAPLPYFEYTVDFEYGFVRICYIMPLQHDLACYTSTAQEGDFLPDATAPPGGYTFASTFEFAYNGKDGKMGTAPASVPPRQSSSSVPTGNPVPAPSGMTTPTAISVTRTFTNTPEPPPSTSPRTIVPSPTQSSKKGSAQSVGPRMAWLAVSVFVSLVL